MKVFAFALLAYLLLSPPCRADEAGWLSFPERCYAELSPPWAAAAQKGKQWEADSTDNLAKLQNLTTKICPAYLAHPNDTDAIQTFSASKGYILDHSPLVEKNGDDLIAFLQTAFSDYTATFSPVGIDFPDSRCGQHMKLTLERTSERLNLIRTRIQGLAKSCFGTTGQQNAAARKAYVPAAVGQGAPLPGQTAAPPPSGGSDITGVQQDIKKESP